MLQYDLIVNTYGGTEILANSDLRSVTAHTFEWASRWLKGRVRFLASTTGNRLTKDDKNWVDNGLATSWRMTGNNLLHRPDITSDVKFMSTRRWHDNFLDNAYVNCRGYFIFNSFFNSFLILFFFYYCHALEIIRQGRHNLGKVTTLG